MYNVIINGNNGIHMICSIKLGSQYDPRTMQHKDIILQKHKNRLHVCFYSYMASSTCMSMLEQPCCLSNIYVYRHKHKPRPCVLILMS